MQRPQGFLPKKGKFDKKYLAVLSQGGGDGEASSSARENKREMSEDEDTTEELAKMVLTALASHRKEHGKSSS